MERIRSLFAIVLVFVIAMTCLLPATVHAAGAEHEVYNAEDLYDALNNINSGAWDGDIIKLMATIDYPYSIDINGKSVTFNLNACNLNVTDAYNTALNVYNNGSVFVIGEGEFNVSGGGYGIFVHDGGSAEVTNATATSMSGMGACAYGSGSFVTVRQTAAAVGDYSAGANASQSGTVVVGSASGSGFLSRGASTYNGGTVTVISNAEADGIGSAGAYAYSLSGETSYVEIRGNARAEGDESYGAYAEGAFGSVVVEHTAGATGLRSIGANATNSGTVTVGSAASSGDTSYGVFANGEGSFVKVNTNTAASGGTGCIGAYADHGGRVNAGSASAIGNDSIGAEASSAFSSVDIIGSAAAIGHTNCTGAYASEGGKVTVGSAMADGVITADGKGIFGAKASGAGSTVEVEQTAEATGEGSVGAFAIDSGKTTVGLNASATGDYSCGASASLGGIVEISGNATSTGEGGCGLSVSDGGIVTVHGNASTAGTNGCGARIMYGGTIAVGGDITASGSDSIGAYVYGGGTIAIDGVITAASYIMVGSDIKYPDDGVHGATPYEDYLIYSDGTSTVRAKFYPSLTITTALLPPATAGAWYSQAITTSYTGSGTRAYSAMGLPSGLSIGAGNGIISGTPAAGADTASPYSVTVTVTDGTLINSRAFSLEVDPGAAAPVILTQPANITRNINQTATFTLVATVTDDGFLSYQWQRSTNNGASWININGATNASYTTGTLSYTNNGYQFRCVVTNNLYGTIAAAISAAAILTVNPAAVAPTIQAQPANIVKNIGETANFTVAATASDGGSLTYQWQRSTNGGASWSNATGTGTTSASFTTGVLNSANNGNRFKCIVTNSKNGTTAVTNSNSATLTMNPAAAAPAIQTQPVSTTKNIGQTATFTVAATASDGGSISYQWQRSTNGGTSWSDAAGTGTTSASYTTDSLTFANNGNRVRCAVTNSKNNTTAVTNSAAATLIINPAAAAPAIQMQPANAIKNIGETATYTVTASASDGGSLTYQWQRSDNGGASFGDIAGVVSTSYQTDTLVFADNESQYRCVVTNSKNGTTASQTSDAATLTINPAAVAPVILTHPANATKNIGEIATFTIEATASDGGSLAYQWQRSDNGGVSFGDIAGAVSTSYQTNTLVFADNESLYRCVVTNSKNATTAVVTSAAALLTVHPAPPVNNPPTAKNPVPVQNVTQNNTASFTASDIAQDLDGDTLTISGIVTEPAPETARASANSGSAMITGVSAGSTSVVVRVSDGTDTVDVSVPIAVAAAQPSDNSGNNSFIANKYVQDQFIVNSDKDVAVDLTKGSDVLSATQIHALISFNGSKPVVLTGSGYTITFRPGSMHFNPQQNDCDLGINFNSGTDYEAIRSLTGEGFRLMLDFQHSGLLPGEAEIRIYTGTQYAGQILHYYYYDPASRTLEYMQSATVGSDGTVILTQSSCSSYVLSTRAPLFDDDDIPQTGDKDALLLGAAGILVSLCCFILFMRRQE